jgi:hypothetical protein
MQEGWKARQMRRKKPKTENWHNWQAARGQGHLEADAMVVGERYRQ